MNKIILSIVYCFCLLSASSVRAQLLNVDAPETVSDSSNLIGKVTDYVKEAQKYVENSQFGKAIGDGVKYAKQGMAYAKEGYNQAMDYYNQGMDYKNEMVNSPEYKIAKKSAEIALLEKKIKDLEKQQEQAQQETNDQISLVQAEADAKIKNLNQNLANAQILMADGDNEQAQTMVQNINNQIAQIKQDAANKVSELQNEFQQKTGVTSQQNSIAISNDEKDAAEDIEQRADVEMDWEISGQNTDDVVAALKPGALVADTLSSEGKKSLLLQKTQPVKNVAATSVVQQPEKIEKPLLLQKARSVKTISGMQKTTTVKKIGE